MKKDDQTKQQMRKAYSFIFVIGLVTLAFIVIILAMIIKSVKFKSYKDIERRGLSISGQTMFSLTEGNYYIYIYSSGEKDSINVDKQQALEPFIANYFTFAKQNKNKSGVCDIRLMDVDASLNSRCLGTSTTKSATSWQNFTVNESSLPLLIYMDVSSTGNNKYSYSYDIFTTESEIKSELSTSISLVTNVAYLVDEKKSKYIL